MFTSVRHKIRTTVRASNVPLHATRLAFRALALATPEVAARQAEAMFLRARRHRRPAWEVDALEPAHRFRVPHEGAFVPAWSFGDEPNVEKPVAILVHGWEGRGSQMGAFVPALVRADYRVVLFDAPGHGDAPTNRASVIEHARALVSVARHVGRGTGHVAAVIGHSVGGAASLLATRFGLQADRLVLLAPPVSPSAFAEGFVKHLRLDDDVRARLYRRIEQRYDVRFADIEILRDAARFDGSLLVIHDRDDREVPAATGAAIARAASDGRFVETQGLGHRRILRTPEVVDEAVRFVRGEDAAQSSPTFEASLDGELFLREDRRVTSADV